MKSYTYTNEKEALQWIGWYFSRHSWLVARQIDGSLPNTREAVQEYLVSALGNSEMTYANGQYSASENGVQVYSRGRDTVWKFSWEQISEEVVQINSSYYSDKLPAPMNETYFNPKPNYAEGLGLLTHWFLRCFKFNLEYLLENNKIELSVDSIIEKLVSYHEKKFFQGKHLKNIVDNSIMVNPCSVQTDMNTDLVQVNAIYTKEGAVAATFNTTNEGIIFHGTLGNAMEYSWSLIAKCICENKLYLLRGDRLTNTKTIKETVEEIIEVSSKKEDVSLKTKQEEIVEINFNEVALNPRVLGSQTISQLSFL